MTRDTRVLLLQVRSQPQPELQEQLCFLETSRLPPERLEVYNLVRRPNVRWRDVEGYDAVFIGGAGAHSATRIYDFSKPLRSVVERLVEVERPIFGSCWGHHFLAWALGGEVIHDPDCGEVGTFAVELTGAGREDPLFAGVETCFDSQLGHHDRVSRLAPGMVELAYSEACRNQAFRIAGLPVYGTQFHSEMTHTHMRERLSMYRDAYLGGDSSHDLLDRLLRPSPVAAGLLSRFLDLYT